MTAQILAGATLLVMLAGGALLVALYWRKTSDGAIARAIHSPVFFLLGSAVTLVVVALMSMLCAALWGVVKVLVAVAIGGGA